MMIDTCVFPTCSRKSEVHNYCFLHKIYSSSPAPVAPKKAINKVAEKRKSVNKEYNKVKGAILKADGRCKVNSPACTGKAQGLNHKQKRTPANLVKLTNLEACCNACNEYIETHADWAKANGHFVSRFNK